MKEKLYTIPLNDAINADTECPFCYIERKIEQDTMDFVLGNSSSYMESDIRSMTDDMGFCRDHFKKMFDYGNTLGNAWILKTHYDKKIKKLEKHFKQYTPEKSTALFSFIKSGNEGNTLTNWMDSEKDSCFICDKFRDTYDRYMNTFFYLYLNDAAFHDKLMNTKGFCLTHFNDSLKAADKHLDASKRERFYKEMQSLMLKNMNRIMEDVSWMIEKFDYRNKDADWKDSKDAIQRAMQKLEGGFPADPVYKSK